MPVQPFDADGDGTTDELLLLVSLWPGQSRAYTVEAAPAAPVTPRAHVRHDARRDDVAWENDRVAFRTYGAGLSALEDLVSSGIDVWTKRTSDLILDRWYAEDEYHTDSGEGADFYSVGRSLGAGGTALWTGGRLWRAPNFSGYRVIADGPLRAVVEMDHGPWDASGAEATETRRVTIDAGRASFRIESTFSAPDLEALRVATGIVDRPGLVASTGEEGGWTWLSTWGPVGPSKGGHGDLGAAVLTRSDQLADVTHEAGHQLLILDPPPGSPVVTYVATAWTAAGEVGGPEDWWAMLDAEAGRLANPLRVSVQTAPLDARGSLDAAAARLRPFLDRPAVDGQIPRSLDPDGALDASPAREWTSGFYPGTLWLLYEASGDAAFADAAREWTAVVEPEKRNGGTHDMGFKIYTSAGTALRLTGDDHYREVVVEAADTLLTRFDPTVGAIRSWDWGTWKYPVIIDNMMNLELLYAASRITGDDRYAEAATQHARTTLQNHFRADGSSYHVVQYDEKTGAVLAKGTHQGYSDASAWSRGQAWALYGYTMAYRESGEPEFLAQAQSVADFILSHPRLPGDGVPYWDFDAPAIPDEPRDASAAAVIASGLYELAGFSPEASERYTEAADQMLAALSQDYLAPDDLDEPFLLDHSVGSVPDAFRGRRAPGLRGHLLRGGASAPPPPRQRSPRPRHPMTRRLPLLLALALTLASGAASAQPGRQMTNLDAGWSYLEASPLAPEAALAMEGWEPVSLPHSWNVWDTVDLTPGYRRDASWYRTSLSLSPEADRRYLLYFEGAAMTAEVYVNGERAGGHVGGYVGFEIDITEHVQAGSNDVMVRVSNAYDRDLIPSQKADYFLFGGLTRDVWLKSVPATYIERVHVLTPSVSAARGDAAVRVQLAGSVASGASLVARMIGPDGQTLQTQRVSVPAGTRDSVAIAFDPVSNPHLWSPASPSLYRVEVDLARGGQTTDSVAEPLGFRWFEFQEGGAFYLNGERLLLRGTHRHEDHAGYASAMPDSLHRRDMEQIKGMGANFVRLGHYPQDPSVYRAADSLGLLIWDELPWNRGGMGGPAWMANTERLLREQIAQNQNHPSVILWSLGNEIYWLPDFEGGDDTERLNAMLAHLHEVAHELDPSRLTAIRKYYDGSDIVDVFSPSIWAGWYSGVYTKYEAALIDAQSKYPRLLHMEYGGSSHVGRHTETPIDGQGLVDPDQWSEAINQVEVTNIASNGDWSESYIVDLFDWSLRVSESLPEFAGNAQWAFKDFGTPLRPENDLPYMNQKGLVTRDGTPKDAYYVFKSVWTDPDAGDAPMCWIESHTWTERSGPAGEPLAVSVYCNTDAARLTLDGRNLGVRQRDPDAFPAAGLTWDVPFGLGDNTLVAVGIEDGAEVTADTLTVTYFDTPAGSPDTIVLTTEPLANGHLLVVATMRDASGRRVLDYEDDVYFSLDGAGHLMVGYGTPTRSQRVAFANGRAAIEMVPGDGPAVVSALNQDFKGSYLPIPAPDAAAELR